MTAQEAAKKWNISRNMVYEYCQCGLIPTSYKEQRFPFSWYVPEIEKPPVKPREFIVLLGLVDAIREGAYINFSSVGLSTEKTKNAYQYLSDCGFITHYTPADADINSALQYATITNLGKNIINKFTINNSKAKTTKTVAVSAALSIGIAKANISVQKSTETEQQK